MQTVFPGERKLKRRLMRQMCKEMLANLIKKILGRTDEQKAKRPSDDEKS